VGLIVRPSNRTLAWTIGLGLFGVWFVLIGTGVAALWRYGQAPGGSLPISSEWPADSRVTPIANRATLIMVVHPQCPCSKASVSELEWIMSRTSDKLSAVVLFVVPTGAPADFEKTDLFTAASAIPGVEVLTDADGVEAQRFGAVTSGHTLLYDADGRLKFRGGITSSRGQAGENAGRKAIFQLVNARPALVDHTPVFGCPLLDHLTCEANTCRP
jgi:hypothetical protein